MEHFTNQRLVNGDREVVTGESIARGKCQAVKKESVWTRVIPMIRIDLLGSQHGANVFSHLSAVLGQTLDGSLLEARTALLRARRPRTVEHNRRVRQRLGAHCDFRDGVVCVVLGEYSNLH
jgi:hypothetical protein